MIRQVLYFPYIRVPQSAWLTQILLYWETVGSIVPYEFIAKPEELGPYMQQLLLEELVIQVQPGAYLQLLPEFSAAFIRYLEHLGPELEVRRRSFTAHRVAQIHMEKLRDAQDLLTDAGLAHPANSPWVDVESETADDFMCYLATCLGQMPEVNSLPLTDTGRTLDRVLSGGVGERDMEAQLQSLRMQVLERVLPIPVHELEPAEIRHFKNKHGNALIHFRLRVEQELVRLAAIESDILRAKGVTLFIEEAREETREIRHWMKVARWKSGVANVGGIFSAVPGVRPVYGLLNAVREALVGRAPPPPPMDFAYAAHVEATFE